MANGRDNLILLKDTDNSAVQAERGAKGGKANKNNPKSKLAATIREMKKKKEILPSDELRLLNVISDPELSVLDIYKYLDHIKDLVDKPYAMIQLAEKYIQLHKAHHGEKIKSESQNLNVNLNIDMMKFQDLAKEYSKKT